MGLLTLVQRARFTALPANCERARLLLPRDNPNSLALKPDN